MAILKNANRAIIDTAKIRDYALNPNHTDGRHKARVIATATGLTRADYGDLIDQIRAAILVSEAEPASPIPFGERFRVVITISGPKGTLRVRTGWIYKTGEDVPRLTTLYPHP